MITLNNAFGNLKIMFLKISCESINMESCMSFYANTIKSFTPEIKYCLQNNLTNSQQYTFYAVLWGRKKDRNGLKKKYKKYLEEI